MKAAFKVGLMVLCFSLATHVVAQQEEVLVPIQVIVNIDSGLTRLNRRQVMSLFLGRARSFPNGLNAKPFDYRMGSELRTSFFEWLTGKSISDIDAYWARLRYSGRTSPPRVIEDSEMTLSIVRQNKNAIAYIRQKDPQALAKLGVVVVHVINKNTEPL